MHEQRFSEPSDPEWMSRGLDEWRAWELALLGDGGLSPTAPLVRMMSQRLLRLHLIGGPEGHLQVPFPEVGSVIAQDDDREWARKHSDFTVAHQASTRLAAAVSQLASHASRQMHLGSPPAFYPHAEFSVLRGALEAVAAARWLLEPDDSVERVMRALRAKHSEATYERDAFALDGNADVTAFFARAQDRLRQAAAEIGRDAPKRLPSSSSMVDSCPRAVNDCVEHSVGFHWRLCSSYAHGYDWADWHHREGEASSTVPFVALAETFVVACDALHFTWTDRWLPLAMVEVPEGPEMFLPHWPRVDGGGGSETSMGRPPDER